jgi:hypothetical protein
MISNLTLAEHYRMYGTFSEEQVERVLAREEIDFDPSGVQCRIEEAESGLYGEDFLAEHIQSLIDFKKRLRGQNKENLQTIIEKIESLAQELFNQGDYARMELREAYAALDAIKIDRS